MLLDEEDGDAWFISLCSVAGRGRRQHEAYPHGRAGRAHRLCSKSEFNFYEMAGSPGGAVERFAKVADYLIEREGVRVVLVGDEADTPILKSVQSRMKHDCLVVSNLSLPGSRVRSPSR